MGRVVTARELPDDPLALESQVCFAMSAGARGLVALYRPLLEPLGLTHPQYLVMLALWQDAAAGRDSTVTALADRLALDPGTLSPLLRRLESTGRLTRSRSPEDARVVVVHLTDAGRALRGDAERVPAAVATATGLTVDELVEIHRAASKVVAAARRAGAVPEPA
jgi:DNA-binding MarR family transcriptional regulator